MLLVTLRLPAPAASWSLNLQHPAASICAAGHGGFTPIWCFAVCAAAAVISEHLKLPLPAAPQSWPSSCRLCSPPSHSMQGVDQGCYD